MVELAVRGDADELSLRQGNELQELQCSVPGCVKPGAQPEKEDILSDLDPSVTDPGAERS